MTMLRINGEVYEVENSFDETVALVERSAAPGRVEALSLGEGRRLFVNASAAASIEVVR